MTKKILIIGTGNIGYTTAFLLARKSDYEITFSGKDIHTLQSYIPPSIKTMALDVENAADLEEAMISKDVVINACPYFLNFKIASMAKKTRTHYLDFSEDVRYSDQIAILSKDADTAFIPQCGLAPGFIGTIGYHLASSFDTLGRVMLRVGALPQNPTNRLKYNLTWNTSGLINEYCQPCECILNGKKTIVQPLEGLEKFSLEGIEYEAFNTSGGLGNLSHILLGKVEQLDYKTIRYPGHQSILKLLLEDLRLHQKQELIQQIFDHALPITKQDRVIIFVSVNGIKNGVFVEENFLKTISHQIVDGHHFTAIQLSTASAICVAADMLLQGQLPQKGFVENEKISFPDFMNNKFSEFYI